ncbi:E3 ubiquitin-protein ligase FANCL isoform X1 [Pieris napi]|uniref:E3 ubiquitin-protein ligase FANCL isoform X1 n=1 Tax=Pieris napi TaxID=78633 RepID=UPI001FBBA00F|nr:E3 ubiquitin-protein ligase FANCL isoform X1 [Pieris napi]
MNKAQCLRNVLQSKEFNTLPIFLKGLASFISGDEDNKFKSISSYLVDSQFLSELKAPLPGVDFAFGDSLRDVKCTLRDEESRLHELYITYEGVKKLKITAGDIPYAPFLEQCFSNVEELVGAFFRHVKSLQSYFYELENIDNNCVVLDPIKPTFKDNFRNIRIDDKTWLYVEVTLDGYPTNMHLIGQSQVWQGKLQDGILNWDHDKNIVENITSIFDLNDQSIAFKSLSETMKPYDAQEKDDIICGICFCSELPDNLTVPQPLCQNSNCDVHFHKSCLFQWLVACEGGRPPSFGIINGSCPTCLQPISCSNNN